MAEPGHDGFDNYVEDENTTKDLYLTFEIDKEDYAIDVANIKEIIVMCAITKIPESVNYLKGIINLRGDIVPVIDVRIRFEKEERDYDDMTCIVVLEYEEYIIGLIVDAVKGVMTIPEENISPPPSSRLAHSNIFVRSLGKTEEGVKLLLDVEKLLF